MYLIKIMDGKLEEFFSLPTKRKKKKVCANQYKGRVASTKNTDLFCVRGSKNPPEHTGCVEVSIILTCHLLDMCAH